MFDELLQLQGIQGVVRFVTRPAFAAPQFGTFVYVDRAVLASLIVHGFGLWDVVPLGVAGESQPSDLERILPWLSFGVEGVQRLAASRYGASWNCPAEIDTWEKLRSLAGQAPSCFAPIPDGVTYQHLVQDRHTVIRESWSSPDWGDNPVQTALVTAYARLFARANLTPKRLTDAFGIDADERANDPLKEQFSTAAEDEESDMMSEKKRRKPWRRRRV
jgi:hypothetical protein